MGKKDCSDCKHRTAYEAVKNRGHKIFICSADGWEEGEGGSFYLMEVSYFDTEECLWFSSASIQEIKKEENYGCQ
jgi:hypothetical protein